MTMIRSVRRAATVVALVGWIATKPVLAQTPDTTRSLAASVQRAAVEHNHLLTQAGSLEPKRMSCGKKAALGTSVGAGVGLASGLALLASTGGSDAFYRILFGFIGMGSVGGLVIGTARCPH